MAKMEVFNNSFAEQLAKLDLDLPAQRLDKGHSLIKFFTQAEWAILPDKLEQLEMVLWQFISGTNVQLESESGTPANKGAVAVIPMRGTIMKRAYGLGAMSGLRTTADIQNDIQEALDNPEISAIVLSTDSPGGTVDGTKELADFVATAKNTKPIVAYVDGLMASAAYWIGSACSQIVCYDTAKVGSVGVVVKHQEQAEAENKAGIKTTFIYQGKYKTAGNIHEPLSDDARAYIQSHVDTYYSMFVDTVAENRGIDREVVLDKIALGSLVIGQQAVKLDLVDSIGNMSDAITLAHKLGEEKMASTELEATVETLAAQVEELTGQITTLTTQNTELSDQLEASQQTVAELTEQIEARNEQEAKDARHNQVAAMFEGMGVDDEFIAGIVDLDDKVIANIQKQVSTAKVQADSALEEFTEQTEGATTATGHILTPSTLDEAIEAIEKRDSVDVDEAEATARKEFPKLFEVVGD